MNILFYVKFKNLFFFQIIQLFKIKSTSKFWCFASSFPVDAVYSNKLIPPQHSLKKLQWTPLTTLRTPPERWVVGGACPVRGGVSRDGEQMQQHRFAVHGQGGPLHSPVDARLHQGGVVRRRGEEVHLRREEDVLPVRHLWPLVHHLALDHRAQCKTD